MIFATQPAATQPAGIADSTRPMVLVVDDQPVNILTLYEILKDECEVCMAPGGAEALAFCATRHPDLVLLDMVMPEMDGREVCRRLKQDEATREIPVIVVTAQSDPAEEAAALEGGAADFIGKPFHDTVVRARVRTQLTLKRQADRLRTLVMVDGLTGIANRRQFDATMALQWASCARSGSSLSMMLIDIDYFKRFNDEYGHQAGDCCLQTVAASLSRSLQRPQDLVARYGGEEFACVLPDTHLAGAALKADAMERAIRALSLPHCRSEVAEIVTVSVGVASATPWSGGSAATLINEADQQLYDAKRRGRGRISAKVAVQSDMTDAGASTFAPDMVELASDHAPEPGFGSIARA